MESAGNRADETLDTALGGRVKVYQPRKGYRFSVDAVLLARFASPVVATLNAPRVVDLCCGSGVIGLCLWELGGVGELQGLDIQQEFIKRALRAREANGYDAGKVDFRQVDLKNREELGRGGVADLVLSNPPYRPVGEGRLSADPSVAVARHEVEATLGDVVSAAAHLLKNGGSFFVVYPAFRLDHLLVECRRLGLAPQTLRLIHSNMSGNATLALLRAVKGGREQMAVLPPLYLHPERSKGAMASGEKYSGEANQLLGGEDISCA